MNSILGIQLYVLITEKVASPQLNINHYVLNHRENLSKFPKAEFIQALLPTSNAIKLEIIFLIKLKNCIHLENNPTPTHT